MQIRCQRKADHLHTLPGFLFSAQPVQLSKGDLQPVQAASGSKVSLVNLPTIAPPPSDSGLLKSLETGRGCCLKGCFFLDSASHSLETSRLRAPLTLPPKFAVRGTFYFFFLQLQECLDSSCLKKEGQALSLPRLISHRALSPPSLHLPLWSWCEWHPRSRSS